MRKLKITSKVKRFVNATLAAAPIAVSAITQPRELRILTLIKAATAFKDAWYAEHGN